MSTLPLTFLSLYYASTYPSSCISMSFLFHLSPWNCNHHKGSHFVLFFSGFHCALYNSQSAVCRTPYLLNSVFHRSQQLLGKEHLACPDYLVDLSNENRFSLTVLLPLALKLGSVFFILLTAACKQFFIYP